MEVRKGYKQTEVGVIPDDWDDLQLEEIAKNDSPICYGIVQVGSYFRNGIPVLAIKNLNSNYVTNIHRTSPEIESRYPRSRVCPDDVLISVKGTTGRVGIVPPDFYGNISRDLARLRFREGIVPSFCFQMLHSDLAQKRLSVAVVGTTRMELSIAILKKIKIPVPRTKAEQEAIAEALSDADALIESLTQLIAKKRQIKQGAMQELLTGKRRLPSFATATSGYKQTEVGVIPEDWEVVTLAGTCSMKSGQGITSENIDQSSQYPCYGGNGLRGFTTSFTHSGRYALIGRQGALCGNVIGVNGEFFASEHAIVVTANAQTSIRWLTVILDKMRLNQYSESSAQPGLSVSKILSLNIARPVIKAEQEAIAEVLSEMDAELTELEAKLAKVRTLKQGMMHELLTGQIRLV